MKIYKRISVLIAVLFMAISEIAYASAPQKSQNIAAARSKELFIAVANANVKQIKLLTTPDFYKKAFPYSDERVRSELLSVPFAKRQKMIEQIKEADATAISNSAGDVITVYLTNRDTNKQFVVQLICEDGDDNWRVFNYKY